MVVCITHGLTKYDRCLVTFGLITISLIQQSTHTLSFKHIFKSQWTLMGFGCCPVTLQPQPQPPGHFWSNYPAAMCIHHYTASRLVRHLNKPSLQKSFQRLQLSGTRSKHQSQPLESKAMRPSGISGLLRLLSSHFSLYPQIYQKT